MTIRRKWSGPSALTVSLVLLLAAACSSLPDRAGPRPLEVAAAPAPSGVLADVAASVKQRALPGQSGFWLLDANSEALNWRLALVDSAQSSLDILYYLWYGDHSGQLLLKRLFLAADRGVKVRLLVDDLILIGKDKALAAIDQHPNIELRLFNPKRQRKAGIFTSSLADFSRMTIRLHNKMMLADNHAVILGGRNVGDHYYGLDHRFNFLDLDVLGFGPVAGQSAELFDNFWNSSWAVSASELSVNMSEAEVQKRRMQLKESLLSNDMLSGFSVQPRDWSNQFRNLSKQLRRGTSQMLYDRFDGDDIVRGMANPLGKLMQAARESIDLVNAYIIPNQDLIDGIQRLNSQGVKVRILTNSLASHDVPAVNSHYKRWRKPLIEAGAQLFEVQANPASKTRIDTQPVVSDFIGLHTKTFVIDGKTVFIGSMNFDPRSTAINTEMGLVIESAELAKDMQELADRDMSLDNAWQVNLSDEGELVWTNSEQTVTRQPARGWWQRVQDAVFRLLPVEQL